MLRGNAPDRSVGGHHHHHNTADLVDMEMGDATTSTTQGTSRGTSWMSRRRTAGRGVGLDDRPPQWLQKVKSAVLTPKLVWSRCVVHTTHLHNKYVRRSRVRGYLTKKAIRIAIGPLVLIVIILLLLSANGSHVPASDSLLDPVLPHHLVELRRLISEGTPPTSEGTIHDAVGELPEKAFWEVLVEDFGDVEEGVVRSSTAIEESSFEPLDVRSPDGSSYNLIPIK